jgi:hypothetical protein
VVRLPARDIGDVRLADHVESGGCPICAARADAIARFIDAMLWESVNDVAFRRELDAARGFCEPHSGAVLAADRAQSGGALGASILFRAVLTIRLREAERAASAAGRTRRRLLGLASTSPDCPVCGMGLDAESGAIDRLRLLVAEPAWAEALATADVCLVHLVALLQDPPRTEAWRGVERRQLERLRDIHRRLSGFVDHSGHDRRHLLTDDERRAVDDAARLLGGRG